MNEISSVQKGDKFEDLSYQKIIEAIEDEKFAFPLKYARVKRKARYFAEAEGKDIVFDLAIEIWPPGAENFMQLFLIECKSYATKKVPIGDLRKFCHSISEVAHLNVKAVFITDSSYTDTSLTLARNKGVMMIKVEEDSSTTIILYKGERTPALSVKTDDEFDKFIRHVFRKSETNGLRHLSSSDIDSIVRGIHMRFNSRILSNGNEIDLQKLMAFFEMDYGLRFNLESTLPNAGSKRVIGRYDAASRTITIDKSIVETLNFGFVLAHEIGHAVMHQNLHIPQDLYDDFEDSEYDPVIDKYRLVNDRNWIEWQANRFAVCLLVPIESLALQFVRVLENLGRAGRPQLYVDNQPCNMQDYNTAMVVFCLYFKVSKAVMRYRLEEFSLLRTGFSDKVKVSNPLDQLMSQLQSPK